MKYTVVPVRMKDVGFVQVHIDLDDLELVAPYHWWISAQGYPTATVPITGEFGPRKRMTLHRHLLRPPAEMYVDHRSGYRLDNRRCNLRVVTPAQSAQNQAEHPSATGVRGVWMGAGPRPFQARAMLNRQKVNLGNYATLEEAHEVVSAWRAKHMTHSVEERHGVIA